MTDPYARRKLIAGIILTILFTLALIGEAMGDRMMRFWLSIFLFFSVVLLVGVMLLVAAKAEHLPEQMAMHNAFYKNWMMPDNRAVSCCHDEDCDAAEAYQKDGTWYARKVSESDKEFSQVPASKIETERDSPDGRSHICGRRYNGFAGPGMSVFCFLPAAGA